MDEEFFVGGIDFLCLERFVRSAVVEAVGDRFFIGGQFFSGGVAEVVEAGRRNEERIVVLGEGLFDIGVARFGRKLHGNVAARTGELWKWFDLEEVFSKRDDFCEVEFHKVGRRIEAELTSARGKDLGIGADGFPAELDVAREEEAIARAGRKLNCRSAEEGLHGGFGIEEINVSLFAAGP